MKKPIPRLYVAGEIISVSGHLYLEAAILRTALWLEKSPVKPQAKAAMGLGELTTFYTAETCRYK
jgi:hypothetical protein